MAKKRTGREAVPRLQGIYLEGACPRLVERFGYQNAHQLPGLEKVVVNMGLGKEAADNPASIKHAVEQIAAITGQQPTVARSRRSVAGFRLREGMPVGVFVTLRGDRMWEFLDRLINWSLPQVRDFRGLPQKGFDGRGNYNFGLEEQAVFPEIDVDKIDRFRGMDIAIVTSASTDEEGLELLSLLGMPFRRPVR